MITVIIPTYNDWQRLSLCLRSLEQQTLDKNEFEILIVDNNPCHNVPSNFFLPVNARVFHEPIPGSYAARNQGVQKAEGEILAFTDSDCIADKNWLLNGLLFFQENNEVGIAAGKIELIYANEKKTLAEMYEEVFSFKQDRTASKGLSVTGNMMVRKHVFDLVGPFNAQLYSGSDFDWCRRATAKGFKLSYASEIVIRHPARSEMLSLIKKFKRVAGKGYESRLTAIYMLLRSFLPPSPRDGIVPIKIYGKGLSVLNKIQIYFLHYYFRVIFGFEATRVSFGKRPQRA